MPRDLRLTGTAARVPSSAARAEWAGQVALREAMRENGAVERHRRRRPGKRPPLRPPPSPHRSGSASEPRRDATPPPRRDATPAARRDPAPPPARRDATPPSAGEWLFTTREGAETDLADELFLARAGDARIVAPSVVVAGSAPRHEGRLELSFARQAFPVSAVVSATPPSALGTEAARRIAAFLSRAPRWALHVWVPDSEQTNRLAHEARAVEEAAVAFLEGALPGGERVDAREGGARGLPIAQICLLSKDRAASGVIASDRALSLAPGGRSRAKVSSDRPSRAARKLAEAFVWLGVAPEPGELCVDLGAAPGGWTWVLLERRARVIAVDRGKLRPDLLGRRGLTYVAGNAFDFEPDEPADWLFCDMAFRPLEVAKMLARWARRKDASLLVANFKLPMRRKAEIVRDVVAVLRDGGWIAIRARQLYHDRDEVTVTARLGR